MNLTVILLNTNFQGNVTLKKSIYKFIKNCLFLSFSTSTHAIKRSEFWIPSRSALQDSQSGFLQRFQKVLLVLLLFDMVLCLIQVTVSFFLIFKIGSQRYFQNFFVIIVTMSQLQHHLIILVLCMK